MVIYDPIEQAIVDILTPLPQCALQQLWGDTQWTKGIKKVLVELGHRYGFFTCASPKQELGSTFGEWLYDMVWFEQRADEHGVNYLMDLPLVVEGEWNHTLYEICYDFEKLIQARARHKLVIFRAYGANNVVQMINELRSRAIRFILSQPGDRYLFAGFIGDQNRFYFELFVMRAVRYLLWRCQMAIFKIGKSPSRRTYTMPNIPVERTAHSACFLAGLS